MSGSDPFSSGSYEDESLKGKEVGGVEVVQRDWSRVFDPVRERWEGREGRKGFRDTTVPTSPSLRLNCAVAQFRLGRRSSNRFTTPDSLVPSLHRKVDSSSFPPTLSRLLPSAHPRVSACVLIPTNFHKRVLKTRIIHGPW